MPVLRGRSVDERLPTVDPRYGEIEVLVHMDDGFIATTTYVENEGFELRDALLPDLMSGKILIESLKGDEDK